jgi:NADH-quinone oxidoreductase subunit L
MAIPFSSGGFFGLIPLIVAFPVLGLLANLINGVVVPPSRRLGEKGVGILASSASGLAFVIAVLQAVSLASHPNGISVPLADWITIGELNVQWAFRVDTLSVTMMLVVSGVGTLIHVYAIGYMHEDVRQNGDPGRFARFFIYLNLFIAMMMALVTADNYLMMFVGWEGVGLCSYLLIGFWYEKGKDGIGNALAARKAFIVNRVGDFGFLMAAFLMFTVFRTFQFEKVFEMAPGVAATFPGVILAITLFMLLGVTGKSAQIPLFVWLPDAMAGPTPVSALIHAATMVTAGVYLVARSHALYALAPQAHNIVALVGGATALFAATIAVAQFDIKKVLAYSTISQLGFMVAAVGMGAFTAGMFHLVTHAFFKALLFLSAGSVIQGVEHGRHAVEHDPMLNTQLKTEGHAFDPQDMHNMGGLRSRMKLTFWVYLIGAVALAGIPPLAGFWSKDEILAEASHITPLVYVLLTLAALLTAFYMARQIILVFFGEPRSQAADHAKENPPVMTVPLAILAVCSLFAGLLNFPGLDTFSRWLGHTIPLAASTATSAAGATTQVTNEVATVGGGGFNPVVAAISTGLALLGIGLGIYLYRNGRYRSPYIKQQSLPRLQQPDDPLRPILGPIFNGMSHKWWIDELYGAVIVRPYYALGRLLSFGEGEMMNPNQITDWIHSVLIAGGFRVFANFLAESVDLGFVDAVVNRTADGIRAGAGRLRRIQTGYVSNYALALFMGVVVIVGYLILSIRTF